MDWITETVAVGNFVDACDAKLLRREGVRSVLSLDGSLLESDAVRLGVDAVVAIHLVDGDGNDAHRFRRAVEELGRLVAAHGPVLVHCHAGRSRSPTVAAGYLMRSLGIDADAAVSLVRSRRDVHITPAVERLLDAL